MNKEIYDKMLDCLFLNNSIKVEALCKEINLPIELVANMLYFAVMRREFEKLYIPTSSILALDYSDTITYKLKAKRLSMVA